MPYDLDDPAFFDTKAVEKELRRVTELCDSCRRCYRLCTSFDYMLDQAVDKNDGDVAKVTSGDFRKIVDLCWQCKLCYNHCPYTPPHAWDIDFPRLMLRAKAARVKEEGVTRQDAWLGDVDRIGALGSATVPFSNWANALPPHRTLLEAAVGIDRSRNLPKFHRQTFARWFRQRGAAPAGGRPTAFFFSCSVNYNEPQVGRDAVSVLERNGCAVSCPEQVCCGMPYLDGGDIEAARENARRNLAALRPLVDQGAPVVVPQPTCSYVLKKDYPMLVPGEDAQKVAAATQDFFEYLAGRKQEGTLVTDFPGRSPGKVAYQMPCHLRAQNMGFKTRDVLQLVPGTQVSVVEKCTAMDGTWGMKKEYYPLSLEYARKAVKEMDAAGPDTYATDCTMSALQIEAVRGKKPAHPISLLREAYGLPEGTMKKIDVKELLDLTAYEKAREGARARIIELKKNRRVSVGDHITVLFENRDTVLFQIQEMVRTERIVDEAKVQEEVDTYNGLIPDAGELSATLFIEIPGIARMSHDEQIAAVNRFQGLDHGAVFLGVGDLRLPAWFEEGRTKEEKMAAVHFLRFRLTEEAVRDLREPALPALLIVDHPNYRAEIALAPAVRTELLRDLD